MTEAFDETLLVQLVSLEDRLRRLEFYLSGSNEEDKLEQTAKLGRDKTIPARLAELESSLAKVSTQRPTIDALLKLRKSIPRQALLSLKSRLDSRYPDLFQPSTSALPTTLSITELLSIINSCATSYPTTASRLDAIKDLPIPPTEAFASLVATYPRLAKVEMIQESQLREMAQLRERTASAIQRWYEVGILGEGECWTEWEGRVVNVEKLVRREEKERARESQENAAYQPS